MFKITFLLILVSITISSVFTQCNVEKAKATFKRSLYNFATEFVNRVAIDNNYHFVTSPLSTWIMVSAISEGADHETLVEIQNVLRHHPQKCLNTKYYKLAQGSFKTNDSTLIDRSGILIIDKKFNIKPKFLKDVRKFKMVDILTTSFENLADTANEINSYIKEKLPDAGDEIVSEYDLVSKYLIMIEIIFFKGQWKYSFSPADTEISSFYDSENKQMGDVSLMFTQGQFHVATIEQLQAKVIELPYGTDDKYSMLILLPNAETEQSTVFDNLKKISIRTILRTFNMKGKSFATVQIPKFKISSELINLKDILVDMGLKSMFERNADLRYMSDYSLYVSDLIQQADIEIMEDGVDPSGIEEPIVSQVDDFTANRPFIFLVIDKESELILIAGAYSAPSVI